MLDLSSSSTRADTIASVPINAILQQILCQRENSLIRLTFRKNTQLPVISAGVSAAGVPATSAFFTD